MWFGVFLIIVTLTFKEAFAETANFPTTIIKRRSGFSLFAAVKPDLISNLLKKFLNKLVMSYLLLFFFWKIKPHQHRIYFAMMNFLIILEYIIFFRRKSDIESSIFVSSLHSSNSQTKKKNWIDCPFYLNQLQQYSSCCPIERETNFQKKKNKNKNKTIVLLELSKNFVTIQTFWKLLFI